MSSSKTLLLVSLFLLSISANLRAESSQPNSSQPNIVFILADDMGYGDLGCYGRTDIKTPNIDQLAKEGVRFTQHYANGPECSPTRTAFLTGRYQQWVGGLECAIGTGNVGRYDDAVRLRETNDLGLPKSETTIATRLKKVGYTTAITGKWHLGYEPKFAPNLHGFDRTFYCIGGGMDYFHYLDNKAGYNLFQDGQPIKREGYFTDLLTDEGIQFINQQNDENPFFLYCAYTAPHFPFQGPKDYSPNPLPLDSPLYVQNEAPPKAYIAMIEHMDKRIGSLLKVIDNKGIRKNTVVIFASDNGGSKSARNAPYSGFKGETYEGGIRVPAIIRWPGKITPGIESQQTSITFDFTHSIAKLAGIPLPKEKPFDGIDIIKHIVDDKPDFERSLFWRKPRGETVWRGLRKGNWKYVCDQNEKTRKEFLFNLDSDPAEMRDLKDQEPTRFAQLKSEFEAWEKKTRKNRRGQAANH